jgi:predicted MPP superfamily phosphohydrolase
MVERMQCLQCLKLAQVAIGLTMKLKKISRRKFIFAALLATPFVLVADAREIEPTWVKIRRLRIGSGSPAHRFVHFTDLHHKGDGAYLQSVVDKINSLAPDFSCFTGDLVENRFFLPETLEILSRLKAPVFGVPGNHDYWSGASFPEIAKCLEATGGAWLLNEQRLVAGGKINLIGMAQSFYGTPSQPVASPSEPPKNILLMHFPMGVNKLGDRKFDLILAGHSHGGQVRIPFYGPVIVPYGCDGYDQGFFQTKAGPLYVNPGIGYLKNFNFRFNCRPEITVIEV